MHTLSVPPAVLVEEHRPPAAEAAPVVKIQAPTPRRRLARFLASLRASVAVTTGHYPPEWHRPPQPGDRPVEMDPIARLERLMLLLPLY